MVSVADEGYLGDFRSSIQFESVRYVPSLIGLVRFNQSAVLLLKLSLLSLVDKHVSISEKKNPSI